MRLDGTAIDAVYASDLGRALETAAIVRGTRDAPLRVTETLRELNYGALEGMTWDELVAAGHEPWLRRWNAGRAPAPPGGEELAAAWARADRFLSCILLRHPGETVLVVTHGGLLRLLVCLLQGLGPEQWGAVRTANTGLTEAVVVPGERPQLVRINDTVHLEALARR